MAEPIDRDGRVVELPPTRRMPPTEDFPTGPAIGDLLPDFTLPDQTGAPRTFNATRAGDRALVVFYRSTRW